MRVLFLSSVKDAGEILIIGVSRGKNQGAKDAE